jgi:hypothetical protein
MRKFSMTRALWLWLGLGAGLAGFSTVTGLAGAALPPPGKPEVLPAAQGALSVVVPDRGYLDDAMALSADGGTLFYIQTDGASFATLRALGLIARPHHADLAPPAAATPPAPAPAAPPPATGKKPAGKKGAVAPPAAPALPAPPIGGLPAVTPSVKFSRDKGEDVLTNLPLSIARLVLLPEDRVLFILRDTDVGEAVQGAIYSLKTKSKVALSGAGTSEGNIGPASDIVVTNSPGGPIILALKRPAEPPRGEYSLNTWNASTLKPASARTYQVRDDGRTATDKGTGQPLYFLDDYQTLVTKHDGFYDKKTDVRQPDFIGFVDTLSGKLRRSQPIVDLPGTFQWAKLRDKHPEPLFITIDPVAHKAELIRLNDRAENGVAAESRVELTLPRPTKMYEATTLQTQLLRRERMVFSLNLDPVNEEAVAAKRTDPDTLELLAMDPQAATPTVTKLLSLPGHKRPSAWVVTDTGRFAILRKHKNFPRGGTQIEVYDVNF